MASGRRPGHRTHRSSPGRRPRPPRDPAGKAVAARGGAAASHRIDQYRCATRHIQQQSIPAGRRRRSATRVALRTATPAAGRAISPSTVIDTTHCGLLTRSPPTITAPIRPASSHIPSASALTCAVGVSGGAPKPTTNAVTRPAHRLDIGGVLRDGLTADIVRCRPVQPKVPALDEHVRRHQHTTVSGQHHRCVVTGSESDVARLGPTPGQPVDHPELADLAQRAIGSAAAHITSSPIGGTRTTVGSSPPTSGSVSIRATMRLVRQAE